MAAVNTLRRALLYVPSSSTRMLEKSKGLVVDNITYDLEDSVAAAQKVNARQNLKDFLTTQSRPSGVKEISVRINSAQTKIAEEDLKALGNHPSVDSIVVPKVATPEDILFVRSFTQKPLQYLIESAKGLLSLQTLCTTGPAPQSLIFAAEDFSLDLSLTRTPSLKEMLFARQSLVTHARAWGVPSAIDLVCTDFKRPETLQQECIDGMQMGFTGKQIIHPSQIEIVQKVFSPSEEKLAWAVKIEIASKEADRLGRGSWALEGKMVDEPVVGLARKLVEKGRLAGMDVEGLFEKYKNVKPE